MKELVCGREKRKIGERSAMEDVVLELKGIEKSFGKTPVLRGISLKVKKGEFITFLGSSGCGKTTTLRIIAEIGRAHV